jgi:hypothetical protein
MAQQNIDVEQAIYISSPHMRPLPSQGQLTPFSSLSKFLVQQDIASIYHLSKEHC